MCNFHHRKKLAWAVCQSVQHLLSTRVGVATFATFTFQENITDKKEAAKRWRRLKERLRRDSELRGVGVWQRQKRGAWHLHYVFDRYIDVHWLRPAAMECGFGPFVNLRIVEDIPAPQGKTWSRFRVINYMTRYLTRDLDQCSSGDKHPDGDEHPDKNVRVVDYMMRRVCTTAFAWTKGFSFLWRVGRQAWADLFGGLPDLDDREFILRLGMHALSEDQRVRVLETSDAVARWWNPEAFPF